MADQPPIVVLLRHYFPDWEPPELRGEWTRCRCPFHGEEHASASWQVHAEWPAGVDQGGPWYLTIRPKPGVDAAELAGGLSSTVMRQVNFQEFARKWREVSAEMGSAGMAAIESLSDVTEKYSKILRNLLHGGVGEVYLAWLSFAYSTLVRLGETSVTGNLAELVDRRPETVRAHLKLARSEGLLTTVRGKAGGQLTEKGREIIKRSEDVVRME